MLSAKLVRRSWITAVISLALAAASAAAGAAGDTFKQSAELGKRTAKTSSDVDKYVAQLDKTEEALSAVGRAQSKNLKKRYESFTKAVKSLKDAQKQVTDDVHDMTSRGAKYFSLWDESIAQISNPELKRASTERRSKVMKEHDELAAKLSDIGAKLQPFMSDLSDVETFLGVNLSTANVREASEMIQKSQAEAQTLKEEIAHVRTQLKQFVNEAPK